MNRGPRQSLANVGSSSNARQSLAPGRQSMAPKGARPSMAPSIAASRDSRSQSMGGRCVRTRATRLAFGRATTFRPQLSSRPLPPLLPLHLSRICTASLPLSADCLCRICGARLLAMLTAQPRCVPYPPAGVPPSPRAQATFRTRASSPTRCSRRKRWTRSFAT